MGRTTSALLILTIAGCGINDFDSIDNTFVGEEAKSHLSFCNRDQLPASMTDLWVYDGGSFGGTIYYVSFKCDTLEDCWMAVRAFGAPQESKFTTGMQTRFAVNQHGPSFYDKGFLHPQWDIPNVVNGVFHESNRDDRDMDFWAIDLDRLRVYFHHESGGFPDDPPSVRHRL